MGLNINYRLSAGIEPVVEQKTVRYNSGRSYKTSFYLDSLYTLTESTNSLRNAELDFYNIYDYLNEASVNDIVAKISNIYVELKKYIMTNRNAFVNNCYGFIDYANRIKNVPSNILSNESNVGKSIIDFIDKKYNEPYLTMKNAYKTNIDDSLLDIAELGEYTSTDAIENSIKKIVTHDELHNTVITRYLKTPSTYIVDKMVAIKSFNNIKKYELLIDRLNNSAISLIKNQFNNILESVDKNMITSLDRIRYAEKADSTEFEKICTDVAIDAKRLSYTTSQAIRAYITETSAKLDVVKILIDTDMHITAMVINKCKSGEVSESVRVKALDYDTDYIDFQEYVLLTYESYNENIYNHKLMSILNEAEDNAPNNQQTADNNQTPNNQAKTDNTQNTATTTTKTDATKAANDGKTNIFKKLVERIKAMFAKFVDKWKELTSDTWFKQNLDAIEKLILPQPDSEFEDYTEYKIDLLMKDLNIPQFDPNSNELTDALVDDATFEKYLLGKVDSGYNRTDDKKFDEACKEIFGTLPNEKGTIKVSEVQKNMKKMIEFCKGYNDKGGLKQSLDKDMSNLDKTRKIIEELINKTKTNIGDNKVETQSTTTTTTTTEKQEVAVENVAEILGLVMEVKTPTGGSVDQDKMKQGLEKASDGDIDSIDKIKERANRYFKSMGILVGARMTVSTKAYKDFIAIFRWGLTNGTTQKGTGGGEKVESDSILPK